MTLFQSKRRKGCGRGYKREISGVWSQIFHSAQSLSCRTYALGLFVGPIYVVILIVDIAFFALLERLIPRSEIDYVPEECGWTQANYERFAKVRYSVYDLAVH